MLFEKNFISFFEKLSPTTGMPTLGINEIKDFERFNIELKAHPKLNSTTIAKSGSLIEKNVSRQKRKKIRKSSKQNRISVLNITPLESTASTSLEKPQSPLEDLNKSYESGEILTDEESNRNTDSTDDDCICIEPDVEKIVIDDNETFYFECRTGSHTVDLTNLSSNVQSNDFTNNKSSDTDNNEIIILDDDVDEESPAQSIETNKQNESVVFVSEKLPDFIPLVSANVPKPLIDPEVVAKIRENKRKRDSLFTAREKEQLKIYNENTYNPNLNVQLELQRKNPKRTVIVDGNNVAFSHSRNQSFSAKGLYICIEYFQRMGHQVKAVLPSYRLDKMKATDPFFEKLYIDGIIVATPCKNLPGLSSNSYDDRFILQLASNYDGAIVSNDNYRDLINENAAFKKLIENRVIGYTWCDDMFMLPKDPYGKFGPTLHSILNRQVEENSS